MRRHPGRRWVLGAATLALVACNGAGSNSASGGGNDTMRAFQGDHQTGLWGNSIAIKPAVRITDDAGDPVAGVAVTFTAPGASNGTASGASDTTDSDGIATIGSWTLGIPGTNTLTATAVGVAGDPVQFTATSLDQLVITRLAGVGQSAPIGTPVTTPPAIALTGLYSQGPIAGATVTWTVTGGGGSVMGAVSNTNAQGVASVGSWTLGPAAGTNQVTATVSWPGTYVVTFAATGTP